MIRRNDIIALGFFFLFLTISGCKQLSDNGNDPLPGWEDTGADSATLNIWVQTNQGFLVFGQYVNLALSQDSLNHSLLVRRQLTNGQGAAVFNRLFPLHYYYNCFSVSYTGSLFGASHIYIGPSQIKDTVLIVM